MATFPSKVNYATGDILTATNMNDVGGAINLLDGAQFAAGKNKIINGDFGINQRNFTSTTTTATYGFDRWIYQASGATATYSAQTFSLGAAPVAGYEGTNFARLAVTTGNDFARLSQYIESVRTFAGQTVTVSFWAKGTNPTTAGNLKVDLTQQFGVGGSPTDPLNVGEQTFVLTANWVRYSFVFNVPSIAGKTLGTSNDNLEFRIGQGSNTSADAWTLDLWGVQVEAGNTASNFQTATGTKQGELAACQRYYQKSYNQGVTVPTNSSFGGVFSGPGTLTATNGNYGFVHFPVVMRVAPTVTTYSYTSSTTSVISNATGTDQAAGSGVASGIGDAGFGIYNSAAAVTTTNGWLIHYAASAEL
jgi:hypothetical protein